MDELSMVMGNVRANVSLSLTKNGAWKCRYEGMPGHRYRQWVKAIPPGPRD
jgi:hypothetical protein